MRVFVFCLFVLISGTVLAQNSINQTDGKGQRQGLWMKRDSDGKLIYQATFKDNKPVGEMKRFHPNGKIRAILNFTEGSDESDAQMFDEHGKLIAKGKYAGQKKNGEWTYLADSKIVLTENYVDGLKEGVSKRFYKTGELLEESSWKNDKLNGAYRSFFQDGQVYLECGYSGGKLNGKFKSWHVDGKPELEATYYDGARDQDWKYFDKDGNLLYTLKFDMDKLLNPEVQDSVEKSRSEEYKTKADDVPDPDQFRQNPEEYMRLMQNQ
ncbi:MAG: toxin-antitoxin system YwqK family antitoxin [Prolixibacteraceae bacterium]|jgi:antitoxin component YwqK of YwqJK toxin-antitoxin module